MSFASSDQSNLCNRGAGIQHHQEIKPPVELDNQLRAGVPILMYHRVATNGPPGLDRFRVDPTLFDEQLSALKQAGFRTIDLGDWVGVLSRSKALLGKPIILTFDDSYRDFLTPPPYPLCEGILLLPPSSSLPTGSGAAPIGI
jgi:hypothetical protein